MRELFDEPATILYQVGSLIVTLDNATQPGSAIPIEAVRAQADALVIDVIRALEGDEETEIVAALMQLSRTLENQADGAERTAEVAAAQAASRQPRQHLLPRPARRDADDQGVHRRHPGGGGVLERGS